MRSLFTPSSNYESVSKESLIHNSSFNHSFHGQNKQNRDLLIYLVWNTGIVTNDAIGKQFGMSYSAVSHSVKLFKEKIGKDRKLKN